jgi:hypothetical protein
LLENGTMKGKTMSIEMTHREKAAQESRPAFSTQVVSAAALVFQ